MANEPQPGDILAIKTGGWEAFGIRLAAALENEPNVSNHIAVVHHKDSQGRWWGLAGQPGGVGWADLTPILAEHYTLNNVSQPGRTDADRTTLALRAEAMLGTPYDWDAIADEAVRAFAPRAKAIWEKPWGKRQVAPGHVICSSYACYLYEQAKWAHPAGVTDREVEPADWDQFIIDGGFNVDLS